MHDTEDHGTPRRAFLKAGGGIVATGLVAGCTGDGGDGGDGGGGDGGGGGGDGGDGDGGGGEQTAESWQPEDDITAIVPYGPGGGYDFYTRALAATLEEDYIDVSVQVQNVEGAAGVTGMNQIYTADPDGHTLGIMNTESFARSQLAQPDAVRYDMEDTTYYPRVAGTTQSIAVSTETDIRTLSQLIDASLNGEINWAHDGPASAQAVLVKALAALGGIEGFTVEHYEENSVTFDGRGEQVTALRRGDVHVMTASYSSLLQFQESGDLRFVMIYNKEDSPPETVENPDCETFATTDMEIQNEDQIISLPGGPYHRLFVGPQGIPDDIHQYWCETITEALQSDAFQQRAEEADRPILYGDCELSRQGAVGTLETYQENRELLREIGLDV